MAINFAGGVQTGGWKVQMQIPILSYTWYSVTLGWVDHALSGDYMWNSSLS